MSSAAPTPYRRLYRDLRDAIVEKRLTGKLPPIVELARQYQVNHNTVKKALAQLKEHRFIYGVQGKGCFVNPDSGINVLAQRFVTLYIQGSLLLNPFYMKLIYALRTLLEAERCNVNLINTASQLEVFAAQTDVLLLFDRFSAAEEQRALELLPRERIVCCNCPGPAGCSWSGTDNVAGGELAMRYLYERNCRNIAVFGVSDDDYDDERGLFFRRRQGVMRFAAAHPDLHIAEVIIPESLTQRPIADEWMEELYRRGNRPDAVFAFMDILTFSIYRFLAKHGLTLPVLGHDDRDFAGQLTPSLSSIREDVARIAEATGLLIRGAICGDAPGKALLIPPEIVERDSTVMLPPPRRD